MLKSEVPECSIKPPALAETQLDYKPFTLATWLAMLSVMLSVDKNHPCNSLILKMADRVGFEPTVELPLHTLSKRAP